MRFVKASEPVNGEHASTLIVRFRGKTRLIENRYGEYWVWQTDQQKEVRVYYNQWSELEYLDESIPASLEQEAETLYPYSLNNRGAYIDNEHNHIQGKMRSAHITAARQYMGEIEKLMAENEKLRKALEDCCNDYNELQEQANRWKEESGR